MTDQRFPLFWPASWKRTPPAKRKIARFHGTRAPVGADLANSFRQKTTLTVAEAIGRLSDELRRLGVRAGAWLISSNVRVRLDGLPYSDQRNPDDPGVAVYFTLRGADRVLACDTWTRLADNLAAVAAHVNALRAIERYGVGTVDQAFAGYDALPAKGATLRTTLGFAPDQTVTLDDVDAAFRSRAREAHPDAEKGSHDAMASLTAARIEAREELGA